MPIIKSSKKALKIALRRKEENDITRAKVKSAVKGLKIAITEKSEEAATSLQKAYRELDLAAKKNVIHKNKASRLKSRLTKAFAKIGDAVVAPKKKSSAAKKPVAKKTTTKKK